jgi:hypothetical protein
VRACAVPIMVILIVLFIPSVIITVLVFLGAFTRRAYLCSLQMSYVPIRLPLELTEVKRECTSLLFAALEDSRGLLLLVF